MYRTTFPLLPFLTLSPLSFLHPSYWWISFFATFSATKGALTTMYDGPRPFVDQNGNNTGGRHYQPAKKQGAIILATGGDNR